jgi:quercetin dioxygenase-like cupin family protein
MRKLRFGVLVVAFGALFVAFNAVPGSATPPSGQTTTLLARGTYQDPGTIPIKQGMDIVVVKNEFAPGGSSGWHSHPGGAVVVVQAGSLTFHRAHGGNCEVTVYSAGQSFIERPGEVVEGENLGSVNAIVFVTFPSVPAGGATRTDEPAPDCAS